MLELCWHGWLMMKHLDVVGHAFEVPNSVLYEERHVRGWEFHVVRPRTESFEARKLKTVRSTSFAYVCRSLSNLYSPAYA